jgi:uncharacterized protein (DUF1778 family)
MANSPRRKDDVIQIRASKDAKALIMRAADLRGQRLSEFMLASARRSAEETLLDNAFFSLDAKAHAQFVALLDKPPAPAPEVVERFRRRSPWAE